MKTLRPTKLIPAGDFILELDAKLRQDKITIYQLTEYATKYARFLKSPVRSVKALTQFEEVEVRRQPNTARGYFAVIYVGDVCLCNYMSGFHYDKIEDLLFLNLTFKK